MKIVRRVTVAQNKEFSLFYDPNSLKTRKSHQSSAERRRKNLLAKEKANQEIGFISDYFGKLTRATSEEKESMIQEDMHKSLTCFKTHFIMNPKYSEDSYKDDAFVVNDYHSTSLQNIKPDRILYNHTSNFKTQTRFQQVSKIESSKNSETSSNPKPLKNQDTLISDISDEELERIDSMIQNQEIESSYKDACNPNQIREYSGKK